MNTIVSMFAGVGGLDMGFEGGFIYKEKSFPPLNFKIVSAYEKDEKCVETIKLNSKIPIQQMELERSLVKYMPQALSLIHI